MGQRRQPEPDAVRLNPDIFLAVVVDGALQQLGVVAFRGDLMMPPQPFADRFAAGRAQHRLQIGRLLLQPQQAWRPVFHDGQRAVGRTIIKADKHCFFIPMPVEKGREFTACLGACKD